MPWLGAGELCLPLGTAEGSGTHETQVAPGAAAGPAPEQRP